LYRGESLEPATDDISTVPSDVVYMHGLSARISGDIIAKKAIFNTTRIILRWCFCLKLKRSK